MTQDLQQLLEKINADGVEKANAEAEKIIGAANARAKTILDSASREAEQIVANAKAEAKAFERRAEEAVRHAARDTLLKVEQSVTALLTGLLLKEVNAAMANPDLVASLASEAVRAYLTGSGGINIATSASLADTLRARFAGLAKEGVSVVTDDRTGTGFKVRLAGGHVEHDFTGAAVAEALSRGLRPQLKELITNS